MKQKKSEPQQQQYHSGNGYDPISSSSSSPSSSSWYIQLRNNSHRLTISKSKQSLFDFIHIRSYMTLSLLISILFFTSLFLFVPTPNGGDLLRNHRSKRQASSSNMHVSDKQHYTNMLRRLLQNRKSSSALADCSINMGVDGVYRLPLENSLSSQVILFVEKTYHKEFQALKRAARQIHQKLILSPSHPGDFALAKFRDEFSVPLRILLTTQLAIKEIHVILAPSSFNDNNGGPYVYYDTIKYYRSNNQTTPPRNYVDFDSTHDVILKQNVNIILQSFSASNARDTLKQTVNTNNQLLTTEGWWIGPVLCENNKNETFLMAHIFPLANTYFLVSYFNISSIDIDQCANSDLPFGGTHKCPTGMECIHRPGEGFNLGTYSCRCTSSSDPSNTTIDGSALEWNETNDGNALLSSKNPCECNQQSCRLTYNRFLRTIVIIIQSIFIVFIAILSAIIFQRRKTKIIKHSMWILLELILLGAGLLYASVIVDSFGPHGIVCLIMPWLRELGFTIVYGTLILRIYKMLAEFQSRKAHCVQVKEKDILRILFFMAISIIGYLLGWTLVNIDHSNENVTLGKYLLGSGLIEKDNLHFQTCRPRSWDYLIQFAEFVFLCVGVRFIYSTRTAPCEYHERKLIAFAIVCEMLFSTLLHIIRDCLWVVVHPDTLFILSVFRCHLTVTCMLILIFCTKLCYMFRPFSDEHTGRDRFRSLPDGAEPTDVVAKLQPNGDTEFGELNIRDMDPEEIRAELKRLYTSLHVLKTKTMRKDNPHLTKRHGQRRKNRRFSMQAFQRHGGTNAPATTAGGTVSTVLGGPSGGAGSHDKHDHDATKTPEDSTGSHNEHTHLGGMSTYRGSIDESDETHGRTLSDATATMSSLGGAGQRVTFK